VGSLRKGCRAGLEIWGTLRFPEADEVLVSPHAVVRRCCLDWMILAARTQWLMSIPARGHAAICSIRTGTAMWLDDVGEGGPEIDPREMPFDKSVTLYYSIYVGRRCPRWEQQRPFLL